MKRNILVTIALLTGIITLQARPVDVATAQRLGQQFIQHKSLFTRNAADQLTLTHTFRAENGISTAYVFNFSGGFVVVAADDVYSPILGYSDCGQFDYESAPDGLLFMLGELSQDIENKVNNGQKASAEVVCQWKNLEAFGQLNPDRGAPVVEPLVQQRWNQDAPFNMYVPGGCPTGCVATAMAQLMKYWDWPVTGTGEHSYYAMGYGEQYANFGETTYQWDDMIDYYGANATQEQKEAVAVLMKHCGVSVNMMYAPDGSGAYSTDVPEAISTYFSYSDHSEHIAKSGHTYDEWIVLLKSNIDQNIPLYYSGHSSDGGHAFICDGYDVDNLFHFNWGWGGSSNGYFLIDGPDFDFSGSQAIVYDFMPDYIYNKMPQSPENLSVSIDSDVSLTGHLSWVNPSETMTGEPLIDLDKVIVKRNGKMVAEIAGVTPGQAMTYDDVVPYFDQFEYTVQAVSDNDYGRTTSTSAVFGPYCEWTVIMTSASFQGWDGGGITVQNAAGSYIDFLTTNTATASMQRFQMALGNNNLYWKEPNSNISNLTFKVKDSENHVVYEYSGPSSGLEAGLIKTLNNSCGNENTCEAPYNLKAALDPDNDRNVILTWDSDHTPEFGYCIYRDGFLFNMAHDTQYVDVNTEIGGHCYYITALCNGGETASSNEYCVTSGSGCDAPTDLYFEYTSNNKVQLYWSKPENENVTGYAIYRKTGDTDYKIIKRVTTNTYKDNSSVLGVVYHYAVTAYYSDTDCYSGFANSLFDVDKFNVEVNWSNEQYYAANPQLIAKVDEEAMTVSLHWEPIYQALDREYTLFKNGLGQTVTATSFVDEDVEVGGTYVYKVSAFAPEGESGYWHEFITNEVTVSFEPEPLPCPAPYDFKRLSEPADKVRLTWSHPYEVRWPDHFVVTVIDHQAGDTTEVVIPLASYVYYEEDIDLNGMDKSYKVKAIYSDCESEYGLTEEGEDFIRFCNLSVIEATNGMALYPNPTSGLLTVEAKDVVSVEVYNLVGQCLVKKSGEGVKTVVDMSSCQNGVYFVKVNTVSGSMVKKVVKM